MPIKDTLDIYRNAYKMYEERADEYYEFLVEKDLKREFDDWRYLKNLKKREASNEKLSTSRKDI